MQRVKNEQAFEEASVEKASKDTRIRALRRKIKKAYLIGLSKVRAGDLTALAKIHETDKWGSHWYTPHYATHFGSLRKRRLKILEIGVGGYDDPAKGGRSLRMWKYYFPRSQIFSLDIYDKSALQEKRIRIFKGSQDDPDFLTEVVKQMGGLDLVIDDGSHVNEHVIMSFQTLFPLLSDGGIYAIEDLQTSYWADFGGDSENLNNPNTSMNLLKRLIDGLHYQEIPRRDYKPSFFDEHITALHVYHNLAFIYKGRNDEPSNILGKVADSQ